MCLKFCEDYFGVYIFINMFPSSWKTYPFPGRSNRDTLTHIVHDVKLSLRYAPDCTFSSRKMKKLLTVGGGTPPPTPSPSPRSVATLPRAWSLRSLAKIVPPPKCFGSLRHWAEEYWWCSYWLYFGSSRVCCMPFQSRLRYVWRFSMCCDRKIYNKALNSSLTY